MVKKVTILAMVLAMMLVGASSALAQTASDQYGKSEAATGVLHKQGITSYQYGTHFITDEASGTGYALKSDQLDLNRYIGERVTVYGTLAMKAGELEGGPALIDVSRIVSVSEPPSNDGSTSDVSMSSGSGDSGGGSGNSGSGGSRPSGGSGVNVLPDTGGVPLLDLAEAGAALLTSGFLISRVTR